MIDGSKGVVVSVFVSADDVLLLPVTSLSNPLGVTIDRKSTRLNSSHR